MEQVGELLFFGEQELRVDPQGRIALPMRFREAFRDGIVLARGYDRCAVAHTPPQWQAFASRVASLPLNQAKNRRIRRMTFTYAFQMETDRQGRVMLPSKLREYARIADDVVIAGMGDHLELWAKEEWLQESESLDEAAQLTETLEDRS